MMQEQIIKKRRRFDNLLLLCAGSLLLVFIFCLPAPGYGDGKKNIFVLHSYHKGLAWTDSEDAGIQSVLKKREDLEVYTEYMDTKRIADARHFGILRDLFRKKYGHIKFDAIILSDEDAYAFILNNHESLFPKVPVVFCGVNFFDAATIEKQRDFYTGVVEAYDVRNTVRTALKLHPDTYRIVVINDRSATGLANKKILNEVMPEFEQKIKVAYFEDLDMADLLKQVRGLTHGDIILLMTFNRDHSGKIFVYDDSISLVAKAASVPMYGVWDFYLGKGIIGGMLTSGVDQGRVAAEMALRILAGEKVRDIPVVKESPNRYMFDAEQMKRFGISPERIPADSIIINKPVSFYEENKLKVWVVAAIIIALSGMLVMLLINIERRKKTEANLRMSEEKFEKIYRFSPDWIAIIRLQDGRYVDVNDAFVEMTGYSREEVIGKTPVEIGIYENPDERYELNEGFLKEGRTKNQELKYRMKSGVIKTVQRSGEMIVIHGEKCVVSIVRDMTGEKQAEQALQESERIKKLLNETQIKMLQAQIKPHFLFNAITAIINYTRTNPKTAADLLVNLAEIFRKSINPATEHVPLSVELEHCENYVGIEKARFEERIFVKYDIDPSVLECRVPPLILQPLVENALRHGILPREKGGMIHIRAYKEEGWLRIYVKDDGVGISQERLNTLFTESAAGSGFIKGSGVALKNVNGRLVALYGPDSALVIESIVNQGTKVSFSIPLSEC
jgi:PAS domain S-box-containing protein